MAPLQPECRESIWQWFPFVHETKMVVCTDGVMPYLGPILIIKTSIIWRGRLSKSFLFHPVYLGFSFCDRKKTNFESLCLLKSWYFIHCELPMNGNQVLFIIIRSTLIMDTLQVLTKWKYEWITEQVSMVYSPSWSILSDHSNHHTFASFHDFPSWLRLLPGEELKVMIWVKLFIWEVIPSSLSSGVRE